MVSELLETRESVQEAGPTIRDHRIENVDLRSLSMASWRFDQVALRGVEFANVDLGASRWRDAAISGASLRGTLLEQSRWVDVSLRGCDFIETQWGHSVLNGVQFLDCCATNGDFTGADIVGCRFESTDMGRTRLEGAVIVDSVFADPRLGSTNLAGASFRDALLVGVDLRDANLQGADLSGAVLVDVDLRGANLRDTALPLGGGKIKLTAGSRVDPNTPEGYVQFQFPTGSEEADDLEMPSALVLAVERIGWERCAGALGWMRTQRTRRAHQPIGSFGAMTTPEGAGQGFAQLIQTLKQQHSHPELDRLIIRDGVVHLLDGEREIRIEGPSPASRPPAVGRRSELEVNALSAPSPTPAGSRETPPVPAAFESGEGRFGMLEID